MNWKIDTLNTKTGEISVFKENPQINENYNLPTIGGLNISNGSANIIANGIMTPTTHNDVNGMFANYITYAKSEPYLFDDKEIKRLQGFKNRTLKKIG